MSHEAFRLLAFRLLKEDGYTLPDSYRISEEDVFEIAEAYRSRLKCRVCNPKTCDGYIYRLEFRADPPRIVGQWRYCTKKLRYRLREVESHATAGKGQGGSS